MTRCLITRHCRSIATAARHREEVPVIRNDPRHRGPAYARKLLHAFGDKVLDIIEATPDRLREVDGIGPVRANRITAAWAEQKAVREIMVFLHSHGVGTGGPHLQDLRA